jgi:predicted enzyme related to lactoylglutathione lyase
MDLTQTRIVTSDVAGLASFYAALIGVAVVANDDYVEVPAGGASVAVSRREFNEPDSLGTASPWTVSAKVVLDFQVDDVDAHYDRVHRLGVEWIMAPTTHPWGTRSMMFRDPEGNVINIFSAAPATKSP